MNESVKITCFTVSEALNVIANAEKSTAGKANLADRLDIELYDTPHRIEVDYTDSMHRSISIYGLDGKYAEARVWKDEGISRDSIASALFSDFCISPESVLEYIDGAFYSVRKFTVQLRPSGDSSITIDTSESWSEEGMDSLCTAYYHAKVTIAYSDEDDRDDKLLQIKKWADQHACGRPFNIIVE